MLLIFLTLPLGGLPVPAASAPVRVMPTGRTIVVNASGGGDYTHIQWAVDNASEGGTVYVEAGVYQENVVINKTLSLIGESRENPRMIGNGSGNILEIMAGWVNITGFNITNKHDVSGDIPDNMGLTGVAICINSNYCGSNTYNVRENNCRIEYNTCYGNHAGIHIKYSNKNIIANNFCTSNRYGILLDGDWNTVEHNYCSDNRYGISLPGSNENLIAANTCNSNSEDGIALDCSDSNTIINNVCNGNGDNGISIGQNDHWESEYNICTNNICDNNSEGIRLSGDSDHNQIRENKCSSNDNNGIVLYGREQHEWWYYNGDWVYYSPDETVVENNFCSDNDVGIHITLSGSNDILNNTCDSNTDSGISLIESLDNMISNNTCTDQITGNGIYLTLSNDNMLISNECIHNNVGIHIKDSCYCEFSLNRIESNLDHGIYNTGDYNVFENNTFRRNIRYGISMEYDSSTNSIYYNYLYFNNLGENQAFDHGINNNWYKEKFGNYWSDWTHPDSDNDGIVDEPYLIDSPVNSCDEYPLALRADPALAVTQDTSIVTIDDKTTVHFYVRDFHYDEGINNYTWEFYYRDKEIVLYGREPEFSFVEQGTYNVLLTIIDEAGNRDVHFVQVTIDPTRSDGNDDDITDDTKKDTHEVRMMLYFIIGVVVLIGLFICLAFAIAKTKRDQRKDNPDE